MTIKELNAALNIKHKLERLENSINRLKNSNGVSSANFGCSFISNISDSIQERIIDLISSQEIFTEQFKKQQVIIEHELNKLPLEDIELRMMKYRYVDCYEWDIIKDMIGYSRSHTFLKHQELVRNLGLDKTS